MEPHRQNTSKKMPLKDPNSALRDVIDTIKVLSGLYQDETEALVKSDTQTFMSLQPKKLEVAQTYQDRMSFVMAHKNDLHRADNALKNRLKTMQTSFAELSQKNMEAINRMQRCTERLGNSIRSAAIQSAQHQRAFSYGETGAIPNATQKKVVSSGISETV